MASLTKITESRRARRDQKKLVRRQKNIRKAQRKQADEEKKITSKKK